MSQEKIEISKEEYNRLSVRSVKLAGIEGVLGSLDDALEVTPSGTTHEEWEAKQNASAILFISGIV